MKKIHLRRKVMRQLPPLNALRAFEAAARHLSFQRAAEELDVTPTAISHQIKMLEDELGIKLFQRRPRPLLLTEEGQRLYPVLRDGFDTFAAAITSLHQNSEVKELTVSVNPTFATKWLVARLPKFQKAAPEIDIRLHTSNDVVDLRTRTIDIAVRYGRGNYPGLEVKHLMSDVVTPVCSPRLLEGEQPLQEPSDLVHHTLLHFEWIRYGPEDPNWLDWLKAADVANVDPTRGPRFTEESLAIQAAIAGQGVALCSSIHAADDIALGLLIQPFEIVLEGFSYYAVYLRNHSKKQYVMKFAVCLEAMAKTFLESRKGIVKLSRGDSRNRV